LCYATNLSGSWVKSTIDPVYSAAKYTSIDIDSANKVHIAYQVDSQALYYITNKTGAWVTLNISGSGSLGTPEENGLCCSLKVDQNDKINIAYYSPSGLILYYASNASGAWDFNTVDSLGAYQSKLAINPSSGQRYILFTNLSSSELSLVSW
jgi:hypothetical protein